MVLESMEVFKLQAADLAGEGCVRGCPAGVVHRHLVLLQTVGRAQRLSAQVAHKWPQANVNDKLTAKRQKCSFWQHINKQNLSVFHINHGSAFYCC